jgi:CxxC motif-containing protein (DUF1111 family)
MSNCITDKVQFPNRKEAVAAMRKFNKTHDVKGKSVYRCPYCKKHHFTSQNRADSKWDRKYHIIQAEILKKAMQIYLP